MLIHTHAMNRFSSPQRREKDTFNADAGPPGECSMLMQVPPGVVVLLLLGVVVVHSHMQEKTATKVHRMHNTHELTTRGGSNSARHTCSTNMGSIFRHWLFRITRKFALFLIARKFALFLLLLFVLPLFLKTFCCICARARAG